MHKATHEHTVGGVTAFDFSSSCFGLPVLQQVFGHFVSTIILVLILSSQRGDGPRRKGPLLLGLPKLERLGIRVPQPSENLRRWRQQCEASVDSILYWFCSSRRVKLPEPKDAQPV